MRQLSYLAVTEEALPHLLACAEIRRPCDHPNFKMTPSSQVAEKRVMSGINDLLERSVRRDFVATTYRRTFSLHEVDTLVTVVDYSGILRTTVTPTVQIKQDSDRNSAGVEMVDLVHSTHERFLMGHLSFYQPFLVKSSRVDFNTRILWRGHTKGDHLRFRGLGYGTLLVYGRLSNIRPHLLSSASEQKLCLYVMDGAAHDLLSVTVILEKLPNPYIYETVRRDRIFTASSAAQDNMKYQALPVPESDHQPETTLHDSSYRVEDSLRLWCEDLDQRPYSEEDVVVQLNWFHESVWFDLRVSNNDSVTDAHLDVGNDAAM